MKKNLSLHDIKRRITEVKPVLASELAPHPGNWRDHPDNQAMAMAGVMREVGDVGVLLAWYSERNGGKLTLIDGHLRRDLAPDHEYMVAITDLNDAEADYVLATYDPLAAMARADAGRLDALLSSVQSGETAVQQMLGKLAADTGIYKTDPMDEWKGMPEFEQEDKTAFRSIVVHFDKVEDVESFARIIGQPLTDKTKSIWHPRKDRISGPVAHYES